MGHKTLTQQSLGHCPKLWTECPEFLNLNWLFGLAETLLISTSSNIGASLAQMGELRTLDHKEVGSILTHGTVFEC